MADSWRAAYSLLTFHSQCRPFAPGAPASSFGLKGDENHDAKSGHTPKWLWDPKVKIVVAADIPRFELLRPRVVLDNIRRSRDDRVLYAISEGQMFSSYDKAGYPAWTWRPYSGSDGHFSHGHLEVVSDPRADDRRPWAISSSAPAPAPANPEDEEDMALRTVLTNVKGRATVWVKEPDKSIRALGHEWGVGAFKLAGAVMVPDAPDARAIVDAFGSIEGLGFTESVNAIQRAG